MIAPCNVVTDTLVVGFDIVGEDGNRVLLSSSLPSLIHHSTSDPSGRRDPVSVFKALHDRSAEGQQVHPRSSIRRTPSRGISLQERSSCCSSALTRSAELEFTGHGRRA